VGEHPLLPDYAGPCVANVTPALLVRAADPPPWLPAPAVDAEQIVLLVLDGLGWWQLQERAHLAPNLTSMEGGPIRTVVPSTTAAALTSIATGTPPGEHGVVGYRVWVDGAILNVLRWSTATGDARDLIPPASLQPIEPFAGYRPPVVTKAEFADSGFTRAHLEGVRFCGYRMTSTLITEVRRLTHAGEPFVYAYYEGVDKVSHEYGLGEHYDAELRAVNEIISALMSVLPSGATLVVTSDHGQVHVGGNVVPLAPELRPLMRGQSGEGRFRWLHARRRRVGDLLEAAREAHGEQAWVRSREEMEMEGWFGPKLTPEARRRLGDVALVAREPVAFDDPADTGPYMLVGRHGSLTPEEMDVPLLAARA